ncbi:hypothetical protein K443DRAFT_478184 [Laccaria amethystina LaAM-08-1]|uniref:Uncharacterized protein n=1 Tax=Laccaria amethystina LaAM-08-1 TaxID=1095629 RepID=A0A0C9WN22_9AGAR|nr:hypothetical protein K443DRAFT_478184 [Laccaria amethystina LaAM-08-1]
MFEKLRLAKRKTQLTYNVDLERPTTRSFSLPSLSSQSQASVRDDFQSDVRTQSVQDVNLEVAMPLSSPVSSREFTKVEPVRMHEAISLRNKLQLQLSSSSQILVQLPIQVGAHTGRRLTSIKHPIHGRGRADPTP